MTSIARTAPVLVTGGSGYVASWIVRYLLEDGLTGFVVGNVEEAAAAVEKLDLLFRPSIRSRFEERFSARAMACEYVRLYRQLADLDNVPVRAFRAA